MQLCACVCVFVFVFVGALPPITCWSEPVFAAGEQWDGVSAIINSEIKCSHLRSQVQLCFPFFFCCYNEAAITEQYADIYTGTSITITQVLCFPSVLWPVPAAHLFWSSSVLLSAAILLCLDVAQRALSETRGWE